MVDLKEYFYNTNHYSDPIIKKFIYDFTEKFDPFLLKALNKEFVNSYLMKMGEMNEWNGKRSFDVLENLIGKESLDKETNILCRFFNYSGGIYEVEEILEEFENLNYSQHKEMSNKIYAFQFCIKEIIDFENSKVVIENRSIAELKTKDYKSEVWFEIGLLIANGKLKVLLEEHKNPTKLGKFLSDKDLKKRTPSTFKTYIVDSIYNPSTNGIQKVNRNTNIYNSNDKILKIYDHCTENEVVMTNDFIEIHSLIELG